MLKSRKFVKRTRKGQVVNVVREHYLRDDLPHPLPGGEPAPPPGRPQLAASAEVFAVLDTNVVLHQLDVLEAPEVAGAVVLGTVLAEARQRSPGAHERLRRLTEHPRPGQAFPVFSNEHHRATYVGAPRAGESPNDRNDRAVRRAAAWLAQQARELGLPGRVVLVTDDAACRAKAQAEAEAEAGGGGGGQTLAAWSTAEWVRRLYPALADAVAGPGGPLDGAVPDAEAEGAGGKRPKLSGAGKGNGKGGEWGGFAEHLPLSALQKGLQAGRLHQGALRVNRFDCWEAWVAPDGLEHEVLVRGRDRLNRATDGDVVAVRLLPREPPAGAGAEGDGEGEGDGPRGEVVGIIRRAWRQRGYAAAVAAADEARARAAPAGRPVALLCAPADRRLPLVRLRTRQVRAIPPAPRLWPTEPGLTPPKRAPPPPLPRRPPPGRRAGGQAAGRPAGRVAGGGAAPGGAPGAGAGGARGPGGGDGGGAAGARRRGRPVQRRRARLRPAPPVGLSRPARPPRGLGPR